MFIRLSKYYTIDIDKLFSYTYSRIKSLNKGIIAIENPKEAKKQSEKEKRIDVVNNPKNYSKEEIKKAFGF